MAMMRLFFRFLIPLLVLGGCGALGWWFYHSRPEPEVMEIPAPLVRVEGQTLKTTVYPVVARSQGAVQPRMRTVLTSEVGGKVVEMSPHFRPGNFFEEGEVLVRVDPVNYETALVEAKAVLAQGEAMLVDEKAKAEQALEGWKALGREGEPGPLLTRRHQVAKAEADVAAAKAQVRKAERDVERTELRAPYAGQVLRQAVDLGQVVNAGADLGEIFAIDVVEVRLPIPEREMPYLKMPHLHRGQERGEPGAEVRLLAREGGKPVPWQGVLVRVEGAVDPGTRQTIAVAEVRDPFGKREDGHAPLKVGQFVEAEILGVPLEGVLVLPRMAVRAGNEIILITEDNRLRRVTVDPLAGDEKHVVVSASTPKGPHDGDVLCVTPIPFPADGARVLPTIDGQTERPGMAGAEGAKAGKRAKAVQMTRES
jgi:multidrug efflux system membrane fusion protein